MQHAIEDTIIVINSSNRVDRMVVQEMFPDDIIKWVVAVPEDQYDAYDEVPMFRGHVVPIPKSVASFLPSQRQWVMEHFTAEGYKYIWLMDDDLTFFRRKMKVVDKETKLVLRKCKKKQVKKMFLEMRKHLEDVPMVGISTRLGNNRITDDYDEINRVTRCYAMNTEVFAEVGAVFNPFEPFVAEDFHMALCFLNAGHKNRILHTYAQEDIGSNADGGCSVYRTAEVQKKTSFWMAENHPEVKRKGKYSKGAWDLQELQDGRNYRVDVLVGWKKAYKPGKESKIAEAVKAKKESLKKTTTEVRTTKEKRTNGGLNSFFKK